MSAGEQSGVSCSLCALFMLAKVPKGRLFSVHSWHFKYLQVRKYSFFRPLDTWMIHNMKQGCLLFFLNWIDIYSLLALALSGKENLTHLMSYTLSDLMVGKILFSFSSLSFPVLKFYLSFHFITEMFGNPLIWNFRYLKLLDRKYCCILKGFYAVIWTSCRHFCITRLLNNFSQKIMI